MIGWLMTISFSRSLCFMELVLILCDVIDFECLLYCRAIQTGVAATEYSITSLSVGYFH